MRTLTRTTSSGKEYWDSETKQIIFIPSIDLTSMTIKELKDYAIENGIEIPDGAKKVDILEILQ